MIRDGDENAAAADIRILRGVLKTTPELVRTLEGLSYRPAPDWLGNFQMAIFGRAYGRSCGSPPELILREITELGSIVDQRWTTAFVQRYTPGQCVRPHRDPKNNIGYSVVGLYGDFTPTRLRVGEHWFVQGPGDVFVLPCTISGKQGPEHEVLWESGLVMPSGTRYAIILNTIR